MFPGIFWITLLLALCVAANPVLVNRSPVTLSISRRVNLTGVHNLLLHDQARAKALKAKGVARAAGLSIENAAVINEAVDNQVVTYIADIGVGSPATTYSLIIDTGSSNTWVGANKTYVKTSTITQTSDKVSVTYGSGSFSGNEFTDLVTLAPGVSIMQSIGVASNSTGFTGVDGILGIGPVDLTQGTLSSATNTLIPTLADNLFSAGIFSIEEIGISFEPATLSTVSTGELTWGGIDNSKLNGEITYIPLTTTSPAHEYWGINQSIRYGTSTEILSSTAGIVDTGTTLVLLARDAYLKYVLATGSIPDPRTGLLRIPSAKFANLQSLFFVTGGATFELTANAQIWPRFLNTYIGGTTNSIYLIVGDLGSFSGGLDFINGYTFLERFYSAFDTTNKRVGFATTHFTEAISN